MNNDRMAPMSRSREEAAQDMIDTGSNGLLKMLRKIGLPIFIKRFDMFGAPMPVFNIDGD